MKSTRVNVLLWTFQNNRLVRSNEREKIKTKKLKQWRQCALTNEPCNTASRQKEWHLDNWQLFAISHCASVCSHTTCSHVVNLRSNTHINTLIGTDHDWRQWIEGKREWQRQWQRRHSLCYLRNREQRTATMAPVEHLARLQKEKERSRWHCTHCSQRTRTHIYIEENRQWR